MGKTLFPITHLLRSYCFSSVYLNAERDGFTTGIRIGKILCACVYKTLITEDKMKIINANSAVKQNEIIIVLFLYQIVNKIGFENTYE